MELGQRAAKSLFNRRSKSSLDLPLPPAPLRGRIGPLREGTDAETFYLEFGRDQHDAILDVLSPDWSWPGKTVLDFGCGSARTLRHFADRTQEATFWGSDIDESSITWLRENLSPPFSFVVNSDVPPICLDPASFDLIYAYSVFTHLSTHWAGWLLEMHRLLKPNGLFVATVMSEAMCEAISGAPWNESEIGMNVYEEGQDWDRGGPMVLHSPWWIENHWGRLFDIELNVPVASSRMAERHVNDQQSIVVARKTRESIDFQDLVRVDPAEPREATALYHDVQHLRAEVAMLRSQLRSLGDARTGVTEMSSKG